MRISKYCPLNLRIAVQLFFFVTLVNAFKIGAVIFYSTADPEYNTLPPTGDLAGSGWELQGNWGYFLGTPISPRHFITARHLGGVSVGDRFLLNGVEYTTTAVFDDPDSDLRIWKIKGQFPNFAALYQQSDEIGKSLVVIGRGTQRGAEVFGPSFFADALKGWQWGIADNRKRWGENRVGNIIADNRFAAANSVETNDHLAELLRIPFDAEAGPNEAHLSAGDSGGGVFIKEGATWKLAGISSNVDGLYNTNNVGPGFGAAIFDESGLFKGSEGNWTQLPDSLADIPGAFYATRISSKLGWINSVLSQPSPEPPVLQFSISASGPYQNEISANVDAEAGEIRLPAPPEIRFYRLSSAVAHRITSIALESGGIVLRYQ